MEGYKVKDLIKALGVFNPEAEVIGVIDCIGYDIKSVGYGGGDGCTESNCNFVVLHLTDDDSEK